MATPLLVLGQAALNERAIRRADATVSVVP